MGWLRVVAIVIALVAALVVRLERIGAFRSVVPIHADDWSCRRVEGIAASEDYDIDTKERYAFISSCDFFGPLLFPSAIYRYDLNTGAVLNLPLLDYPSEWHFAPHGIFLAESPSSSSSSSSLDGSLIFVVNHAPHLQPLGVGVSVFELMNNASSLRHVRTVTSPLFRSLNAVVAAPGTKGAVFYAVNDHHFGPMSNVMWHRVMSQVEDVLGLRWSTLVKCETKTTTQKKKEEEEEETTVCETVGPALESCGVGLEIDDSFLYVSQCLSSRVLRLSLPNVDIASSHISHLHSAPDNLRIHNGELWIGSHPNTLQIMQHLGDGSNKCPSQVIRVTNYNSNNNDVSIQTQWQAPKESSPVSAVSTGMVVKNGTLLVLGTIRDGFAVCQRKK